MSKKSLFDSDDDSGGIDHSGYAASLEHGIIDFESGSFARANAKHGGPPPPPPPPPPGTLASYISGDANVSDSSEYNIKIVFQGTWSASLQQAFIDSANAISKYITADVPNINLFGENVDDIRINASLVNIDGVGGILGQAGPDYVRSASWLPISATMQFDVADANSYQNAGLFDDIVMHEMLHSVGFGSIWQNKGLVAGAGTATPTFTGVQAVAWYDTYGHGVGAPRVENDGGSGTALSHWDEQTFTNELMTGYINSNNDLSYMTVASLGDLGYAVVDFGHYTAPGFI